MPVGMPCLILTFGWECVYLPICMFVWAFACHSPVFRIHAIEHGNAYRHLSTVGSCLSTYLCSVPVLTLTDMISCHWKSISRTRKNQFTMQRFLTRVELTLELCIISVHSGPHWASAKSSTIQRPFFHWEWANKLTSMPQAVWVIHLHCSDLVTSSYSCTESMILDAICL